MMFTDNSCVTDAAGEREGQPRHLQSLKLKTFAWKGMGVMSSPPSAVRPRSPKWTQKSSLRDAAEGCGLTVFLMGPFIRRTPQRFSYKRACDICFKRISSMDSVLFSNLDQYNPNIGS